MAALPAGSTAQAERAALEALLQEHRPAIQELRSALVVELALGPPPGDPLAYDDVWLLRYVLSFASKRGGALAATQAARKALAWRRENAALLAAASRREPPPGLGDRALAAYEAFSVVGFHKLSRLGDPVFVIRTACCDLPQLMDELSPEVVAMVMTYIAECAYQYLDHASRRRGYLVKVLNVQDLTAAAFARESRFFRALGMAAKRHEWLYPQKDMKSVIFRPPRWVGWAFGLFKTFMPKSAVDKVWIHSPVPMPGELGCDLQRCPFASRLLDPASVSVLYGGADREGVAGVPSHLSGGWAQRHPGESWESLSGEPARVKAGLVAVQLLPLSDGSAEDGRLPAGPSSPEAAAFFSPQDWQPPRLPSAPPARPRSCWERCCGRRRRDAIGGPLLPAASRG